MFVEFLVSVIDYAHFRRSSCIKRIIHWLNVRWIALPGQLIALSGSQLYFQVGQLWHESYWPVNQPAKGTLSWPSVRIDFGRNLVRAISPPLGKYWDFPVMFSNICIVSRSLRIYYMSRCYVLSDAVPSDSFMCAAHFITHLETVVFGARRWLIFKSAF